MTLDRAAGIVIVVGVVMYVLAMFVSPALYQEPDIAKRVTITQANRLRWNLSQLLFGLGISLPAVGFALLALQLGRSEQRLLSYAGAAAFLLGAIFGATFVYRQTFDPVQYWQSGQPPALVFGYVLLTLSGLLLYSGVFLRGDFPAWMGYLALGAVVLSLAAFGLTGGTIGFAVASLAYAVALVVGIVLVTQMRAT